jgi:hypothetical protein
MDYTHILLADEPNFIQLKSGACRLTDYKGTRIREKMGGCIRDTFSHYNFFPSSLIVFTLYSSFYARFNSVFLFQPTAEPKIYILVATDSRLPDPELATDTKHIDLEP